MRNSTLHSTLESFIGDAASALEDELGGGAEIPFEVVESEKRPAARVALYCYRPLTSVFIKQRLGVLSALPSYAPAVRALANLEGVDCYLRARGEPRVPAEPRDRADAALHQLLDAVFDERSEFAFDERRFKSAYAELEDFLYAGRHVETVIAPILGLALHSTTAELPLGDGLSLVRGETLADAPPEAVWGTQETPAVQANVLAVLTAGEDPKGRSVLSLSRRRFRRLLTTLRLFERGGYALGPIAWTRLDASTWRPAALGGSGRPRLLTLITPDQEDELRAFFNLIGRRASSCGGEVAWALARFEMGCERLAPFEALTDYLLALRALLEPEGPSSGRLAQRLAVICAPPDRRAALAERTAHAISLERAVISGLAPAEPGVDGLVDEVAEHLRALLRDVLCGHLNSDLRGVADDLLAESAMAAP